jgi:hypothetical protein
MQNFDTNMSFVNDNLRWIVMLVSERNLGTTTILPRKNLSCPFSRCSNAFSWDRLQPFWVHTDRRFWTRMLWNQALVQTRVKGIITKPLTIVHPQRFSSTVRGIDTSMIIREDVLFVGVEQTLLGSGCVSRAQSENVKLLTTLHSFTK